MEQGVGQQEARAKANQAAGQECSLHQSRAPDNVICSLPHADFSCDHIWVQDRDRGKVHPGKRESTEWDRLKDTGGGGGRRMQF